MSMQIPANSPVQPAEASSAKASKADEVRNPRVAARAELNASIVQSSIDVSIGSKNEPLALLLKSAINGINDLLKPEFGENAIQNAVGQDNTPEGTAGRIVSLSTGFFEAFKANHAGEDEAEVLKNFMTTIRGGFEQGFKEASDILKGMNVLNGDIAGNIDKTYALVQKGFADFEAAFASGKSAPSEAPETSENKIV
ncbi:MAG: DUF5610 domain-containing protein [Rhodocyclaceae bacterium]